MPNLALKNIKVKEGKSRKGNSNNNSEHRISTRSPGLGPRPSTNQKQKNKK